MSADSAKAPGIADLLEVMDLIERDLRGEPIVWEAHPDVVAVAEAAGVTVDELVQRGVSQIDPLVRA